MFVSYQGQAKVAQAFAALGGVVQAGFAFGTYCLVSKAVGSAYLWEDFVREELPQEEHTYEVIQVRKAVHEISM